MIFRNLFGILAPPTPIDSLYFATVRLETDTPSRSRASAMALSLKGCFLSSELIISRIRAALRCFERQLFFLSEATDEERK